MEIPDFSPSNDGEETQTAQSDKDKFGQSLYPLRRKNRYLTSDNVFLKFNRINKTPKVKCEAYIMSALKVPMIRLLTEALESSGCPVDLSRHIVCEECDLGVSGGYDQEMNQIVICQDSVSISKVISTMSHELIHMFDNCTTTMDYQNNDHLACTEIRAANLTGCSFLKSVWEGTSKFWDVDQTHQTCVRNLAIRSVIAVNNVDNKTATEAVDRVFVKCYNDLEPVGRRIRKNSDDVHKSYKDAFYLGYTRQNTL